jgi:DNA-binding PadR family transcriptional regulator
MGTRRPKTFLGDFELTVLLAVLRLDQEAYGAAILREIEQQTGRSVPGGALYITLDRMEAKGLIRSRLGDAGANRGGRPRRYVTVTNRGFAAVRASRAALLNMMDGLDAHFRRSGES